MGCRCYILLNPFAVATCLSRSTLIFTNTSVLVAVWRAVNCDAVPVILALAISSAYLSIYPVLIYLL